MRIGLALVRRGERPYDASHKMRNEMEEEDDDDEGDGDGDGKGTQRGSLQLFASVGEQVFCICYHLQY